MTWLRHPNGTLWHAQDNGAKHALLLGEGCVEVDAPKAVFAFAMDAWSVGALDGLGASSAEAEQFTTEVAAMPTTVAGVKAVLELDESEPDDNDADAA